MTHLVLEKISKQFGSVLAVRGIDLQVREGEYVSLLGPSGCGKTTTLHIIAGLLKPSTGRVILNGQDITGYKPSKRGLGVVFQSYALFPHFTVAENVAFGLEMRNVNRTERAEQVRDMLDLVQLSGLADRYPRQLSGGQKQRVAVARALVINPSVLLLDEPLSNLDAKLREEMQFELRRIQRKIGITTIMVTHDQAEALSISDRVVVMEEGQITQVDNPHQLYERPRNSFIATFVGKNNLLNGVVKDIGSSARIEVCDLAFELPPENLSLGQNVMISIRPERISICPSGLGNVSGHVKASYFFGSHWLLKVRTSVGDIAISAPNHGTPYPSEGTPVELGWSPSNVRIVEAGMEKGV